MFFELMSKKDLQEFLGCEIFSVKDLKETSFGSEGESLFLIKAIKNGKLVRHYVNDLRWHNAEDIYNVEDLSFKWQGYLLYKLTGTKAYDDYVDVLEKHYMFKHKIKSSERRVEVANGFMSDVFKVLDYEEEFLQKKANSVEKV